MYSQAPFKRYNLLSIRLSNRIDNRLYRAYKHSSGCQTRLRTGLTTGWIKPVGCLFTRYSRVLNRLYIHLDNRLYRVNEVLFLDIILTRNAVSTRAECDIRIPSLTTCREALSTLYH